jgi:F420-non-reducing hydrogenase iron-sulfur subunit
MVREKKAKKFKPLIVAFCCNWCSYAGADLAGTSRFEYPPNIRIVRVMCTGRIDSTFIFETLRMGADGILVAGCHPGDCHYQKGNFMMEKRFNYIRKAADNMGMEPERVRLEWISASEAGKFSALVREMTEQIEQLGPNSLINKANATVDAFRSVRLRWVMGRSQIKVDIDEAKYGQAVDLIMHDEIERQAITRALREKGPLTVQELAELSGLQPSRIVRHIIALRKNGVINEAGEKDRQHLYQLV